MQFWSPARDQIEHVKELVSILKDAGRSEAAAHRKIHRPWGNYDSIDNGVRFQVKRMVVNPGASLSMQMHYHRAEHWIVVTGTARVTRGDEVFILAENQSTYWKIRASYRWRLLKCSPEPIWEKTILSVSKTTMGAM